MIDEGSDDRPPATAGDLHVYESLGKAVADWRAGRLGWAGLLHGVGELSSNLSDGQRLQRDELNSRVERLRGLGDAPGGATMPDAPRRLIEREVDQLAKIDSEWRPPPPRPRRSRAGQFMLFAGLLGAYGAVDLFFGKPGIAALCFGFAAIFVLLGWHARVPARPRKAFPAGPPLGGTGSGAVGPARSAQPRPRQQAGSPADQDGSTP